MSQITQICVLPQVAPICLENEIGVMESGTQANVLIWDENAFMIPLVEIWELNIQGQPIGKVEIIQK